MRLRFSAEPTIIGARLAKSIATVRSALANEVDFPIVALRIDRAQIVVLASLAFACGSPTPIATAPGAAPATERAPPIAVPLKFEPTSFGVVVTGAGRPIILIPGLGCPGSVWDGTIAHTKGEFHTLTVSGFGGRPPLVPPPPRFTATIRDELARYIRDRRLDHPVVVGHSMGGFLALWLAATEPDLVGPIVAVDAAAIHGPRSAESESIARRRRDAWIAMPAAAFVDSIGDQFRPMFTDPKHHAGIIAEVARSDQRAFADAYYELFTSDIRADLPGITAPVLAIVADGPFQETIRIQLAEIPNHDVVVAPRSRHFVMHDNPDRFYALLDRFLASNP